MNDLLDRIWMTKVQNCRMFAAPQLVTERLLRWIDEKNPRHYNKNHFFALGELTASDIHAAIQFQKQNGLHGFLLKSRNPLAEEIIATFGLREEKQLIMALIDDQSSGWKNNSKVQILDCQTADIAEDLIELCLSMSNDAAEQRWIRRAMEEALEVAEENANYHWLLAMQDGKAFGFSYVFEACGCIQMEDLWVDPQVRRRSVGSTMMKYIADHFSGTFFLHAEAAESVKMMYDNMGFIAVDEVYEYSKVWRDSHGTNR